MIGAHEKIQISLQRLEWMEQDSKDLKRAKALIARLRAENAVLKQEKKNMLSCLDSMKNDSLIEGNAHKKYAATLIKIRANKARSI